MSKFFKDFWRKQDTLDKMLFWIIFLICCIIAIISTIFTAYEGLSFWASLASACCTLILIAIGVFAAKSLMYSQCYFMMCAVLNFFLLPLLFFFCGGSVSGMPYYLIMGVFLVSFCAPGMLRTVLFFASLAVIVTCFFIGYLHPDYVVVISPESAFQDIVVSFVLVCIGIFFIVNFVVREYKREVLNKEKLVSKLDFFSNRDVLTGLFNRRYLINFLENIVWQQRDCFYILMLSIDDFREIIGTHGYIFGDEVLLNVGHELLRFENEAGGECAARFGGNDIVYVIHAGSELEAFSRAESFRQKIYEMEWKDHPDVKISVSGVFAACRSRNVANTSQLLHMLFNMHASNSETRKNQIRNIME